MVFVWGMIRDVFTHGGYPNFLELEMIRNPTFHFAPEEFNIDPRQGTFVTMP
jgi:hypothetical protein